MGAHVYGVSGAAGNPLVSFAPPDLHAPAMAARHRVLYGNLFADMPAHHLLRIPLNEGEPKGAVPQSSFDTNSIPLYQYLFVMLPDFIDITGDRSLLPIARGKRFVLYRLES